MAAEHAPITITAFKWVPPFAKGQVRDFRLRWMMKEVGWTYAVEQIDGDMLADETYRAEHPFGQVPLLREEGRPTLFETGGIVLDIAERSGKLLPTDEGQRALAKCWTYAALNSVEPFLFEVFVADMFLEDKAIAKGYRPFAEKMAKDRLEKLANAISDKDWLVGADFTIADLMMSSVVKVAEQAKLVEAHDNLTAWRDRCFARPAYREAIAEQCADFENFGPKDMGWDEGESAEEQAVQEKGER
jgi:glutathione S-transferase